MQLLHDVCVCGNSNIIGKNRFCQERGFFRGEGGDKRQGEEITKQCMHI
jgi:hypothetical protein